MLWDLYQTYQIHDLQQRVGRQSGQPQASSNEYIELRARIDKLALINMAMWSLLKEHTPLTENDLLERVKEIDLQDGQLDGKVRTTPQECPECGRKLSQKHQKCLYCGHSVQGNDAFGGVT